MQICIIRNEISYLIQKNDIRELILYYADPKTDPATISRENPHRWHFSRQIFHRFALLLSALT